jgi:hypothetical protein
VFGKVSSRLSQVREQTWMGQRQRHRFARSRGVQHEQRNCFRTVEPPPLAVVAFPVVAFPVVALAVVALAVVALTSTTRS